jgi:dihydrofolate reductase
MRKLFLQMMVSIDGYVEDAQRQLDWHFVDADYEAYSSEVLRSVDGVLLGRKSYELFASFWPTAGDAPGASASQREAARLLNALPKLVVSRTLAHAAWNNTRLLREDFADELRRLKAEPGKDLVLFAGAQLADSCIRAGLVDEYRLVLNPILLGGGTPLFAQGRPRTRLRLTAERSFASGARLLVYRPAT